MANEQLESWVMRAQRGELEAFRKLWETCFPRMKRLADHLCGDTAQADDLVQAAFVQAWKALPTLREPGAFVGWLRRILVNRTRDFWRAQKPNDSLDDDSSFEPVDCEPLVTEAMEAQERQEAVRRAVAALPEPQRFVVALYYLEEMEVLEVASTLGIPKGTVLSRLSRGREALRGLLSGLNMEVSG
jgi:RNA polymerase sigma-70 factor (ECF subfamily)